MLQRIYGVAFNTQEELQQHLAQLEEAKKRDHRKLERIGNFIFDDEIGQGLPLWLPNGAAMIEEIEKLAVETESATVMCVRTPHVSKETF